MAPPSPVPQGLIDVLYDAVRQSVPEEFVAVAFSGGVDSSILAKICHDGGKKVTLITVGFAGAPDIAFSKKIALLLGMPQRIVELEENDFMLDLTRVRQKIVCNNTSHVENCIAYFYIARAAKEARLPIVLSANGCDELFCGYNGYRQVYGKGEGAVAQFMEEKLANERELVKEISFVAKEFGVEVRQPFLSERFIDFAKGIPLDQKIKAPDDLLRKHILRQAAIEMGVPQESALKPKKALQYGSMIHRHFKKGLRLGRTFEK